MHVYIYIYICKKWHVQETLKHVDRQTDRKYSLLGAFDHAPIFVNHLPQSWTVFVLCTRYVLKHWCVHVVCANVQNFELHVCVDCNIHGYEVAYNAQKLLFPASGRTSELAWCSHSCNFLTSWFYCCFHHKLWQLNNNNPILLQVLCCWSAAWWQASCRTDDWSQRSMFSLTASE